MKRKVIFFALILGIISTSAFAYTRDWNNASPIDHTLNKNWPSEDRKIKADVEERLDDIMDGFTSGDTVTQFNRVPFYNQASDETGVTDSVVCYSKDVSSESEIHCVKEDDDIVQITAAGYLNGDALVDGSNDFQADNLKAGLIDFLYPVGSIYIETTGTNPNTTFGSGTWTAFGTGKVLVGYDSGDADFDTAEETGGVKEVTLTAAQSGLPAHTHTETYYNNGDGGTDGPAQTASGPTQQFTSDSNTGASASEAHTNVQPYIVVYMWKRTS